MPLTYNEQFYMDMKSFRDTYGFETWWPKGGYYSDTWQRLVDYYKEGIPDIITSIHYTIEGDKINNEGMKLLADGIDKPVVGIGAEIIYQTGRLFDEVVATTKYFSELANNSQSEIIDDIVQKIYESIAGLHNEIVPLFTEYKAQSIEQGMPTYAEVMGGSQQMHLQGYPVYTVMPAGNLVDFARLVATTRQAEEDIKESYRTNALQGILADYYNQEIQPKKGKNVGLIVLGGGLILLVGGMFIYTIHGVTGGKNV